MREICMSGSTRGRRVADSLRCPPSYSTVHPVRQEKPGRSSEMEGAHHVNYPFDM